MYTFFLREEDLDSIKVTLLMFLSSMDLEKMELGQESTRPSTKIVREGSSTTVTPSPVTLGNPSVGRR